MPEQNVNPVQFFDEGNRSTNRAQALGADGNRSMRFGGVPGKVEDGQNTVDPAKVSKPVHPTARPPRPPVFQRHEPEQATEPVTTTHPDPPTQPVPDEIEVTHQEAEAFAEAAERDDADKPVKGDDDATEGEVEGGGDGLPF